MASLLTQCPHCQTSFRVRTSQLAVAEGQVRCGSCLGVFSARDNEIRVKTPQPPLLDEPLTEEELSSVTAAEPEDAAPPRERSGSWLDDDDDEYAYEDAQPSAPLVHAAADEDAAVNPQDEIREEYAGEEYHDAYAKEYEDEPVLREPVLSFAADADDDDASEEYADDEEIDDETDDAESDVHEEYADDEEVEEYLDEDDRNEPVLREPVLSFADTEPRFSTQRAKAEPEFSLYADSDDMEPGFSATDDDDDRDDYRQVRSRYAAPSREDDKRQVRRYVEEIEDEEALDELAPDTLDYLDDEPVHIAPERRKRGFFGSLLLFVGSLLLMAVAALQLVNANLDTLSQSARFALLRPYVCQVLTCPAEQQQVPSTLSYEQLVVRAHPKVRDALEVSAVLRNNGAATQALPGIEVTFRDGKNAIVGSRVFTPAEYLPAELRTAVTLPSQSTVQARMEMADPGVDTLNYEMTLRPLSGPIKH